MIVVRLTGGLGNQMFQYAFGLAHSSRSGENLKVDVTLLNNVGRNDATSRNFGLSCFNCSVDFTSCEENVYFNGHCSPNLAQRIAYKLRRIYYPKLLIIQHNNEFSPYQLAKYSNTCFVGRWQSEEYFKDYQDAVRNHFTFKDEVVAGHRDLIREINLIGVNSVSIHIRRGDYVSSSLFSEKIGFVGERYYRRGINKMLSEIDNPFFFVFSDDQVWADDFMKRMGVNYLMVKDIHVSNSSIRDLLCMSICKHHIISNSTFSWWGAWLSTNNGLVIAPSKWAKAKEYCPPYILPKRWMKIECEL